MPQLRISVPNTRWPCQGQTLHEKRHRVLPQESPITHAFLPTNCADEPKIVARVFGDTIPFGRDNGFRSADLILTGAPFDLPAGPLFAAAGVAYRQERQRGTGFSAGALRKREAEAAFVEMLVPLIAGHAPVFGIEQAELSLAVRHEEYSDFGSTTDPRVGLALTPAEGLTLRGTYGTSFKAPRQSTTPGAEFLTIASQLDPTTSQNELVIVYGGVVPDIGPETAESWTVGFDWQPAGIGGLRTSLTYYDIVFDGRIAIPAPNAVTFLGQPGIYGAFITYDPTAAEVNALLDSVVNIGNQYGPFDPEDVYALIDFRARNVAVAATDGFDLSIDYMLPVRGVLNLELNVNYVRNFINQPLPGGPVSRDLDTLYRPLKLRLRGGLTWGDERFSLGAFVNHAPSYANILASPDEPVGSYTTIDANLRYGFSQRNMGRLFEGLAGYLTVRNLLNEEPPFVSTPNGGNFYDGANADPFGRMVVLGISKQW